MLFPLGLSIRFAVAFGWVIAFLQYPAHLYFPAVYSHRYGFTAYHLLADSISLNYFQVVRLYCDPDRSSIHQRY